MGGFVLNLIITQKVTKLPVAIKLQNAFCYLFTPECIFSDKLFYFIFTARRPWLSHRISGFCVHLFLIPFPGVQWVCKHHGISLIWNRSKFTRDWHIHEETARYFIVIQIDAYITIQTFGVSKPSFKSSGSESGFWKMFHAHTLILCNYITILNGCFLY